MTRILPQSGITRGLIRISKELEIPKEFTDMGYMDLTSITLNLNRNMYQYWKLISYMYSPEIKQKIKVWNIDGEVVALTEDGCKYNYKEIEFLKDFPVWEAHNIKKIFGGEVVKCVNV